MKHKVLDTFVSVVYVADCRSTHVASSEKVPEIAALLKSKFANYEVVVIDNGIPYQHLKDLEQMLKDVACIRIIRLSKIAETDTAVFAGIEASIGDFVCIMYNNDPVESLEPLVEKLNTSEKDIIFGIATNLRRKNFIENVGAKIFYWYNRKFLKIDIPYGSTFFIGMNRSAVNALTRSGRYSRHIRYLAKQIGFKSENFNYELPRDAEVYNSSSGSLLLRAINLISSYSSHPLKALTYFGIIASILNLIYAAYVLIINIAGDNLAKGWTTLSLQSSLMFFVLFLLLALLSEYIGQILEESRGEAPYHIKQELSSTISIADETRRNVTK